jgi:hypothetical protein
MNARKFAKSTAKPLSTMPFKYTICTAISHNSQTLIDKNILSAPVYDEKEGKYIGFLDIRDLVSWVVFVYDEQKVDDDTRLGDLIKHGLGQFKMSGTDGVTVSCMLHGRGRFLQPRPLQKAQVPLR